MKESELRIGNIIYRVNYDVIDAITTKLAHVVDLTTLTNIEHIKDGYEPIPLTQQWLEKLGFSDKEYKDGYIGIDVKSNMTIDFVLTKPETLYGHQKFFIWEYKQGCLPLMTHLQYVHQLQNLFFSLTGQELTIKQ